MRTTIDIPEKLIKNLKSHFKGETMRSIVILALENLEKRIAMKELIKWGGKIPEMKNIDLDKLRDRNHYKKFL